MSCYSPLRAVVLGYKPDGKKILKVIPDSDFTNYADGYEYISLPCGHCVGCRLRYSRIWADRCLAEASYHDSNIFLTLTYNDSHLPRPLIKEREDGSLSFSKIHPLVKRDVQLFIKRLRKHYFDQDIRYFLCGEYGSKSMRPHYHLILFGLFLDDLKPLYMTSEGFSYYTSESIEKLWYVESDTEHSAGFHIITDVNWSTCAYVARYIMKKQYGHGAEIYDELNYPKEFTLMSRRPGIGRQFYEDHKLDIYSDKGEVFLSLPDGAHSIKSNRYYDRLYDLEFPDHFSAISDDRKRSMLMRDHIKEHLTDKFYLDILDSEGVTRSDKIKALKRGDF